MAERRTFITSDDVELSVVEAGDGPPVVLLPGYGAPARSWELQMAALEGQHRMLALDRRNHGRSGRPAYGQRMSRHAKDVAELLDAVGLDEVLLVGSSMGANIALAYVDLFGCQRLRGLVLVDQTPKMVNEDGWDLGFFGLTREGLDAWVARFPDGVQAFRAAPPPEVLELAVDGPPFSIEQTRALLRDHAEADWRDVLPRIDVPVLAVAGRHSPVWPWQSSAWMADAAPHGRLAVLDGSGHAPHLEEPAAFNALLVEAARR